MTTPSQTKSMLNQDLIQAARQGLIPVSERAWLGGFGNMLRKELGQWWGTRTWWILTLIWVLIINGITTIVMLTEELAPAEMVQEAVQTFLMLGAFAVGIGTIITLQGAIVGEKQLGTAAWVLSKPASRSAFILSKAVAYAIGFWVTGILIPAIIFVIEERFLLPDPLALEPFLIGLGLVALGQLFYLVLTLMLGAFFNTRGPIIGIPIAFIIAGLILKGMFPPQVMYITPWLLPDIASALTLGMPLPPGWQVPIAVTAIWIVIMIALALWRFSREEF
jgi:ABC-2 type transport system permease protein